MPIVIPWKTLCRPWIVLPAAVILLFFIAFWAALFLGVDSAVRLVQAVGEAFTPSIEIREAIVDSAQVD